MRDVERELLGALDEADLLATSETARTRDGVALRTYACPSMTTGW